MRDSYLDYSMSVIIGRALPDARDGLKPVHRRILFAMNELNLSHRSPYKSRLESLGTLSGSTTLTGYICLRCYGSYGTRLLYESSFGWMGQGETLGSYWMGDYGEALRYWWL